MVSTITGVGTIVTLTNTLRKSPKNPNVNQSRSSSAKNQSQAEWKSKLFNAIRQYNTALSEQYKACEKYNPYDVSSFEARNSASLRLKLWQDAYYYHSIALKTLNDAAHYVGHKEVYNWAMQNNRLFLYVDIDRFGIIEPMEVDCGKL